MIGYDMGGPGGSSGGDTSIRDAWNNTVDYIRDRTEDVVTPIWDWVENVTGSLVWVLERIEVLTTIRIYAWRTANDERTCPECGPLDGQTWDEFTPIAAPPIHTNCRCKIVHVATDVQSRWVDDWQLRWQQDSTWEWRQTGWA